MKRIIAFIGPIASGKDTAAEYLSKKENIPLVQISDALRSAAKERGMEPTRQNLIKVGASLVQEKGPLYLLEYVINNIQTKGIITGIRIPAIIDHLKKTTDVTIVAFNADPRIRFNRSVERGRLGEAETLEDFVEKEQTENSQPNSQRVFELMQQADFKYTNEGTLEDLYCWVDTHIQV